MDQTHTQEVANDARETGSNPKHGGHDASDPSPARSSSRRQSSNTAEDETSRDEEDGVTWTGAPYYPYPEDYDELEETPNIRPAEEGITGS